MKFGPARAFIERSKPLALHFTTGPGSLTSRDIARAIFPEILRAASLDLRLDPRLFDKSRTNALPSSAPQLKNIRLTSNKITSMAYQEADLWSFFKECALPSLTSLALHSYHLFWAKQIPPQTYKPIDHSTFRHKPARFILAPILNISRLRLSPFS